MQIFYIDKVTRTLLIGCHRLFTVRSFTLLLALLSQANAAEIQIAGELFNIKSPTQSAVADNLPNLSRQESVSGIPTHTSNVSKSSIQVFDVSEFGARGDDLEDDSLPIQNAINAIEEVGGGLYFPKGRYLVSRQLVISAGIHMFGEGFGSNTSMASQPSHPVSEIVWEGKPDSQDAILLVRAKLEGNYVYDFVITDMALNCQNSADTGIHFSSTRHSSIGRLWVERCRKQHVLLDDGNKALNAYTTIDILNIQSGSSSSTNQANGLVARSAGGPGVTRMSANVVVASTRDGFGVVLGDVDGSSIFQLYGSIYFRGFSDHQLRPSRKNLINYLVGGKVYAEAGSRNIIQWINSEGTSVTIEPGAVCHYGVIDRKYGRRWESFAFPINVKLPLALNEGYPINGSPMLALYGLHSVRGISFKSGDNSQWQWVIPPLREISGGRVTGVELWGVKNASDAAGNVLFEVSGQGLSKINNNRGSEISYVNHAIPPGGAQTLDHFCVDFVSPVKWPVDSHFLISIGRIALDTKDTFPSDYGIVSAMIKYEADVADHDGKNKYRYQPSADQNGTLDSHSDLNGCPN